MQDVLGKHMYRILYIRMQDAPCTYAKSTKICHKNTMNVSKKDKLMITQDHFCIQDAPLSILYVQYKAQN